MQVQIGLKKDMIPSLTESQAGGEDITNKLSIQFNK